MKTRFLVILAVSALVLTGCKNGFSSTANYTPSISMSAASYITAGGDTLYLHYAADGTLFMDTMNVSDTVCLPFLFEGYANNLISTSVAHDTAMLKAWVRYGSDFAAIITPASDSASLYFAYQEGYSSVSMPVMLVPKKAGASMLNLQVVTDSEYSTNELSLQIRVR